MADHYLSYAVMIGNRLTLQRPADRPDFGDLHGRKLCASAISSGDASGRPSQIAGNIRAAIGDAIDAIGIVWFQAHLGEPSLPSTADAIAADKDLIHVSPCSAIKDEFPV